MNRVPVTNGQRVPSSWPGLLLPGGDPELIIDDGPTLGFVTAVATYGGVVAGICAGVLVMAAAGLVAGRSIIHSP